MAGYSNIVDCIAFWAEYRLRMRLFGLACIDLSDTRYLHGGIEALLEIDRISRLACRFGSEFDLERAF